MNQPTIITREEQTEEQKKIIRGYAIVFNSPAPADWLGEGWQEQVSDKAFDDVDITRTKVLFGHNSAMPIGRNGVNARIEKDDTGIFVEVELPNTTVANDLYELIRIRIVDGMSFGAWASAWEIDEENKILTWSKFEDLQEVSFVTFPFYEQTTAIAREMQPIIDEVTQIKKEHQEQLDKLEKILKEEF